MKKISHKERQEAAKFAYFDQREKDHEHRQVLLELGGFRAMEWLHKNGFLEYEDENGRRDTK